MRFLILLVTNDVTHADLVNADLYQNKKKTKNVRAKDWGTLIFWNRLVNDVTVLLNSEITLILGGQQ